MANTFGCICEIGRVIKMNYKMTIEYNQKAVKSWKCKLNDKNEL